MKYRVKLSNAELLKLPQSAGVYKVCKEEEVMFVGCTFNFYSHWGYHRLIQRQLSCVDLSRYYLEYEVYTGKTVKELQEIKRLLIVKYKPKWNNQHNKKYYDPKADCIEIDFNLDKQDEPKIPNYKEAGKRLFLKEPEQPPEWLVGRSKSLSILNLSWPFGEKELEDAFTREWSKLTNREKNTAKGEFMINAFNYFRERV